MTNRLPVLLIVLTLLGGAGCNRSAAPAESAFLKQHVGETCVVQFRRDALGGAAPSPVSPNTDNINGADVIQVGKLLSVDGGGLVLEATGTQPGTQGHAVTYWIPYPVILSVRFTGEKKE